MAEITIGNDVFTVNPLPGEESFVFQPRILPLVAELVTLFSLDAGAPPEPAVPSIEDVAAGEEAPPPPPKPERDLGVLLEQAAPVVQRACARMPPEELRVVVRTLLRGARMNGQELYKPNVDRGHPIDLLLRGRVIDMWKLVMFALQVSYPDFFDLFRGFRKKSAAAAGSETSATSSPGPSGG